MNFMPPCHVWTERLCPLVGAGAVTAVLDFGRFVLDSNAAALERLGEEEAAVYLPFALVVRNVSAYLVDGAFSWSFMGSQLAPLLAAGGVVSGGEAGPPPSPAPLYPPPSHISPLPQLKEEGKGRGGERLPDLRGRVFCRFVAVCRQLRHTSHLLCFSINCDSASWKVQFLPACFDIPFHMVDAS